MPVNPWSHDDFEDDDEDLAAQLEAAMQELEELKYLFPTTDTFTHLVASDPVLGDFALTKGHRRPDKHSCLRYWQFLVLEGPTASTAYHMRSCDFCRSTMKDVLDQEDHPSLKALYDRLWTMPLDPTDEEVDQMEALADLKKAIREIEEEDIAARVAERRSNLVATSTSAVPSRTGQSAMDRRKFLVATASLGMLAIGFLARGWLSSIAAPRTPPVIGNSSVLAEFANLDRKYATSGITAIQSAYATGTDSDALRILRWIRERKHLGTMGFLASCMSDPRTDIRWAAVKAGLLVPPIALKPHLLTVQAAATGETNPAIQNLFVVLIPAIQNA